jgi:hypothetical protein
MYIKGLRLTNNSASGTTFHYERKYKSGKARGPLTIFAPESIRALGPITESLYIVVSPFVIWSKEPGFRIRGLFDKIIFYMLRKG